MPLSEIAAGKENIYIPELCTLTRVEQVTASEKLFEIRRPGGADLGHRPGQFVQVSILGVGEAPISVSSSPTRTGFFELCVRAAGKVTNALHALKAGDTVGIRGPYGTFFPADELKGKNIVFIGGGIGLVPLRSFIQYSLDRRGDYRDITILYGTRSPSEILFGEELEEWRSRRDVLFDMTVDRGDDTWTGKVGLITILVESVPLPKLDETFFIVVGPPIMYRFVLMKLFERGVSADRIIVSLERMMKCGVGKCGHCAEKHIYICMDGPVFNYGAIKDIEGLL